MPNGSSFYFREKYNLYYERKRWIDVGGNPIVRCEDGVSTILIPAGATLSSG